MAGAGTDGRGAGAVPQPNLTVIAQYVKDLSFENPGAPATLRARAVAPNINIGIGVQTSQMAPDEFEVELKIDARAVDGDTVLFAAELAYAGVFKFSNIPPENVRALTMIECPRLLFPFARQIVAEASRNGGFPPLLIDPVDFVNLYRQRVASEAGAQAQPTIVS